MRPRIVLDQFPDGSWDIVLDDGDTIYLTLAISLSYAEACEKALKLKDNFNNLQGKIEIRHDDGIKSDLD